MLPARSPLRTLFLLTGGGALPLMRVVLIVEIGGRAESVIDGMATNVETQPGEGGVSKLVVKGKDMSAIMDTIELPGIPYPAMPPSTRVLVILAKYAAFGVVPNVIPGIAEDLPTPVERDLSFWGGASRAARSGVSTSTSTRSAPRAVPS